MSLRCLVFSSDEGTTAILRQILSGVGVEGEFCSTAVSAAEQITNRPFQIVIIDWDQQPEAGVLLNTARERKAAERPLTLTIVSKDGDAPEALHAGANSLLRKPLIANQARETLTTARDLLHSKQGPTPASASIPIVSVIPDATGETTLRAGDFLQTPTLAPGELFETESTIPATLEESGGPIAALKDLEPMASSVAEKREPAAVPPSSPSGSRGLEWYLKNRSGGQAAGNSAAAAAPAPVPSATPDAARGNPELLGYDQSSSYAAPAAAKSPSPAPKPLPTPEHGLRERKKEAELFAYMQGDQGSPSNSAGLGFTFAKRAIVPAMVLAAIAVAAAPQAPWHPRLQGLWRHGRQAVHAWLNPQTPTPTQVVEHESFTRPGDEYKLPVAEAIPDATTDPSQIEVVPVVDPTIKKTNPQGGNVMDPTAVPVDGSAASPETPAHSPAGQDPETPAGGLNSDPFRAPVDHATTGAQPTVTVVETPAVSHADAVAPATAPISTQPKPSPALAPQPRVETPAGTIPPSLKSQIAPSNSMIGGNKPMDAAGAAIEPVQVSELSERALMANNVSAIYPSTAKGQQGTVVLQVLIARDGSVQDAKFMQGSLVFARNAIEAVRQWKFKPYLLNGRPVSVQTQITVKFKPGQ
ncbi:MAG TPA: TonB family protein [Candidatus Sulfotelmatobacter sp.]